MKAEHIFCYVTSLLFTSDKFNALMPRSSFGRSKAFKSRRFRQTRERKEEEKIFLHNIMYIPLMGPLHTHYSKPNVATLILTRNQPHSKTFASKYHKVLKLIGFHHFIVVKTKMTK